MPRASQSSAAPSPILKTIPDPHKPLAALEGEFCPKCLVSCLLMTAPAPPENSELSRCKSVAVRCETKPAISVLRHSTTAGESEMRTFCCKTKQFQNLTRCVPALHGTNKYSSIPKPPRSMSKRYAAKEALDFTTQLFQDCPPQSLELGKLFFIFAPTGKDVPFPSSSTIGASAQRPPARQPQRRRRAARRGSPRGTLGAMRDVGCDSLGTTASSRRGEEGKELWDVDGCD